jgi:hypothetical protein
MTKFESIHGRRLIGTLTTFDRMIFKGHLTGLYRPGAFKAFLNTQGVLLKGYAGYVKKASEGIKSHAQRLAVASRLARDGGRDADEDPQAQLTRGDNGHGDGVRRRTGKRADLLPGDDRQSSRSPNRLCALAHMTIRDSTPTAD